MAYPTKYRFLSFTKKGKIKANPIEIEKLSPKKLGKYGLIEEEEDVKRKGLTSSKGLVSRGSRKLYREAKLGGLVGRNKVIKGYKKGGQV
jgi:hypothetical protein